MYLNILTRKYTCWIADLNILTRISTVWPSNFNILTRKVRFWLCGQSKMYWFVSRYHRQLHFQSDLHEVIKSLAICPMCEQISSRNKQKVGPQKALQTFPKSSKNNLAFQRISSTISSPEGVKSACMSQVRFWGHTLEAIGSFPPRPGAGQHAGQITENKEAEGIPRSGP